MRGLGLGPGAADVVACRPWLVDVRRPGRVLYSAFSMHPFTPSAATTTMTPAAVCESPAQCRTWWRNLSHVSAAAAAQPLLARGFLPAPDDPVEVAAAAAAAAAAAEAAAQAPDGGVDPTTPPAPVLHWPSRPEAVAIAPAVMPSPQRWLHLADWVEALALPLVGEFTLATATAYVHRKLPFFIAFVAPGVDDADVRQVMEMVAPEFHAHVSFMTADALEFADQMLRLGLDPTHVPALVYDDFAAQPQPVAHLYFAPVAPSPALAAVTQPRRRVDAAALRAFLHRVVRPRARDTDGVFASSASAPGSPPASPPASSSPGASASPSPSPPLGNEPLLRKSAPAPTAAASPATTLGLGPLIDVVGVTFEEAVLSCRRDVLLLFYAPACGFCKAVLPLWDELAAVLLAGGAPIAVARFDVSRNTVPSSVKLTGVPAIYYVYADEPNGTVTNLSDPAAVPATGAGASASGSGLGSPASVSLRKRAHVYPGARTVSDIAAFALRIAARARGGRPLPPAAPAAAAAASPGDGPAASDSERSDSAPPPPAADAVADAASPVTPASAAAGSTTSPEPPVETPAAAAAAAAAADAAAPDEVADAGTADRRAPDDQRGRDEL